MWTNGWIDQDVTWYVEGRPRPRRHCVTWRPVSPQIGAQQPPLSPLFGPCLLWPNGWMDQDTTWYGGRPRPKRHYVRWRPISPQLGGTAAPHFSAHACCGQTAGCIKMPLGMEVPCDDIVSDGDPVPPRKRSQQPPHFGSLCSGTVAHLSNC